MLFCHFDEDFFSDDRLGRVHQYFLTVLYALRALTSTLLNFLMLNLPVQLLFVGLEKLNGLLCALLLVLNYRVQAL